MHSAVRLLLFLLVLIFLHHPSHSVPVAQGEDGDMEMMSVPRHHRHHRRPRYGRPQPPTEATSPPRHFKQPGIILESADGAAPATSDPYFA